MKKSLVLVLALVFSATPVFAASESIPEGMAKKAVRGAVNLFTGIIELPMQICKGYQNGFGPIENEAGSKTVGTVLGFFRGLGHSAGRITWGATELIGFWSANPESNEGVGVPFDAEFAWEQGEQYSIFEPSLAEGIKPIGRKLGHGLVNGLLGLAEIPGQIKLGAQEGNVLKGVVRGFWFALSRQVYGIGNVYSALVPNAPDNPGYAFNRQWPWEALTE